MSTILNNDFVAGTVAEVAEVNTKFTDVQTATGQLNADNVRSESVDLWNLGTTASMVKASGSVNTVLSSFTRSYVSSATSGTSPNIIQQSNGSGGNQDMVLDLGSSLTVSPHDLIRVYWNVEVIDQVRTTESVYTGGSNTGPSQSFWGVWLQRSANNVDWYNVPNQGSFSNQTVSPWSGFEMLPISVDSSTTKAFMPIPHVLHYVDNSGGGTPDVLYDYGQLNNDNYTTGSAWMYCPTTSDGPLSYRYFRLVLGGVFQSINNGASPPVSYIVNMGARFAQDGATPASITLRRINLCAVHLRGS